MHKYNNKCTGNTFGGKLTYSLQYYERAVAVSTGSPDISMKSLHGKNQKYF